LFYPRPPPYERTPRPVMKSIQRCTHACQYDGKQSFETRGDALRWLRRKRNDPGLVDPEGMSVYHCREGHGWHVGHPSPSQERAWNRGHRPAWRNAWARAASASRASGVSSYA